MIKMTSAQLYVMASRYNNVIQNVNPIDIVKNKKQFLVLSSTFGKYNHFSFVPVKNISVTPVSTGTYITIDTIDNFGTTRTLTALDSTQLLSKKKFVPMDELKISDLLVTWDGRYNKITNISISSESEVIECFTIAPKYNDSFECNGFMIKGDK